VLSHMVYFTLKDPSDAACQKLVDSCHHYLPKHDGVEFFAAGTRTPDLDRPVNDCEFHVAVNVVFTTREAQDIYQVSENHLAFIADNKDSWAQLRVFDADVA
jgi:hypothetical protein